MTKTTQLRWKLAESDLGQGTLFADDEIVERHVGKGEFRGLEFLHVNAKTIINEVPRASKMRFRYTINVYRGCSHACTYCFARPTHEYLGLDAGRDFESKIVVKINAVERLKAELASPRWLPSQIAMGTNTDPYQRCEGKYHLTRGILQTLTEARNPFSILTKSTLILRDLDVLQEANHKTSVGVNFSIGSLDEQVWKETEPGTPHPKQRIQAVARLNKSGIRCGVLMAPILPGLSDRPEQLAEVVNACVDAGATSIMPIGLHLRPGVREQFMSWLSEAHPELVPAYRRAYVRSYLTSKDQQALTGPVRELVSRAKSARVPLPADLRSDHDR